MKTTSSRPYRSTVRQERLATTRARILEASAAIVEGGGELTYAAVAAGARVRERTVYRHFPTKGDLESGLWTWILDNVTHVDLGARTEDELVAMMRRSFAGFDAGAPLVTAMLHSEQGIAVRARQQPEREAMFDAAVRDAVPGATPELRQDLAAALQVLYSATAWDQLRAIRGIDGAEAARVIETAIRLLLAGARASPRGLDGTVAGNDARDGRDRTGRR